jgi:DNA-binding CsgD family transcriptional regulator/PAS domain-containing protein
MPRGAGRLAQRVLKLHEVSAQSYSDSLDLVYRCLEDAREWRRVCEHLRAATGSESIHLFALDHRHGTLSYSDGANLPVEGELAYMQRYRFIDPRMPLVMRGGLHEWMHCHESLDDDFVARDPFYQEFLLPYGRRYASACKLVAGDDATVILSTLRTPAQGPLPASAVAFIDALLPHLSRVVRIGIRDFVYSTQALVGRMLVNKLRQPVILMTPGGDVMHANDAARRLLGTTALVRVTEGRLSLAGDAGPELLRCCNELERALKAGGGAAAEPVAEFQSLQVSAGHDSGEQLYAFFTLLPPQEAMGAFGLRPVVMLLFYHPASAPAIDSSLLFAVFGLTPAECRIATALAEGRSLKEIARLHGTQHDTVRKQLRSIYQKTATNRQPELVRLLLHLPHNTIGL